MNNNRTIDPTKAVLGAGTRWLYPQVFEPASFNGGVPRYSVCLLIPKTDTRTVDAVRGAIEAAFAKDSEKYRAELEELPPVPGIRSPLRDGDTEHAGNPNYAGCFYLYAVTRAMPVLRDRELNPITDPKEIYAGCYGRASVRFSFSCYGGSAGFTCWLNGLQKCRDGESLAGRSVDEDFAAAAARESEEEEDLPF